MNITTIKQVFAIKKVIIVLGLHSITQRLDEMKEDQPRFEQHWIREDVQESDIKSYLHKSLPPGRFYEQKLLMNQKRILYLITIAVSN